MTTYFKILKEIVKKNKKQTAICFLIMFAMSILQVLIPLAMKGMIAEIETSLSWKTFAVSICIYTCMWLGYNAINVKWYKHIDILGEKVLWLIREKVYDIIWNCEYSVYREYNKDYLKNVLFSDVISIYGNIILYSLNMIADSFMIVVFLLVSLHVDVLTTLILIATVGIGLLLSIVTKPAMTEGSKLVNQELKKDNATNNECVDAIELIRTNGLSAYYKKKVKTSIRDFIEVAIKTDQKNVFLQNLMDHYHQIMVMVITGILVLKTKEHGAGSLVYYIFVTNLVIEKSKAIEGNLFKFMKNMAAFENVDKLFQIPTTTNPQGAEVSAISEIKFEKVGLKYSDDATLFSEVSFTLKKGDAVLVKGENGSGKSSILKMIAGLISPTEGRICYDGVDFFDVNRQSLYKSICYLNQEELLLNENLADYLNVIAHKEISQTDFRNYADKVMLTKEYGKITDNGKSFSGGEKKKAIIMKLLARKDEVSVIMLDEIETGLDKQSQKILDEIESELLKEKEKYIILKISHRNMKNMDAYNKVIEL